MITSCLSLFLSLLNFFIVCIYIYISWDHHVSTHSVSLSLSTKPWLIYSCKNVKWKNATTTQYENDRPLQTLIPTGPFNPTPTPSILFFHEIMIKSLAYYRLLILRMYILSYTIILTLFEVLLLYMKIEGVIIFYSSYFMWDSLTWHKI